MCTCSYFTYNFLPFKSPFFQTYRLFSMHIKCNSLTLVFKAIPYFCLLSIPSVKPKKDQNIKYVSENIFFLHRLGACDPHDHFQSTKSRRSISTECRKRNANLLGFLISYESLPAVNNFPCFITLRLSSPKKCKSLYT